MRPIWFVAAMLAAALSAGAQEVALQAGLARVEITPSTPMAMAGYPNRTCAVSTGTADPLYAKVLVLATGNTRIAIVTADLAMLVSARLRAEVAAKLGIPVLLLSASHTHSGPSFGRPSQTGNGPAAAYTAELDRRIFGAIKEAAGSLFPAHLSAGRGSIRLGYNRLIPGDDGRSHVLYVNRDFVPYGPLDPEFMLLRVEDAAGTVRALVVHYACHAVVLGASNCRFSADYPGVMRARVEARMKGVQCMFVQGGAGDINPIMQGRTKDDRQDYAIMTRVGELLADAVLRSARDIRPGTPLQAPIRYASEVLTFANRWDKSKTLAVGLTTVLIGRDIALAAVPGEPMHRLQMAWKNHAEVPYPFFYGYTYSAGGEWPGYIPDLRSAAHGGYGAESSIEIGAGETIVQHHLKNLYGLLGFWRDKPGKP